MTSTASVPGAGYIETVLSDVGSVVGSLVSGSPILPPVETLLKDALGKPILPPIEALLKEVLGGLLGSVPGASGIGAHSFVTPQTLIHGAVSGTGASTESVGGAHLPFSDNTAVTLSHIIKH